MINKKFIVLTRAGQRGFTLMETMVAILVLSIALTGPFTLAQKGLQAALISKDQITAFYLAQDAIEYIRYARDTNCLAAGSLPGGCPTGTPTYATAPSWLNNTINLTPCISSGGTNACTVDVIGNTPPAACVGGVCAPIYYDSGKNYFTYSINDSTTAGSMFTRTITITSPVCNAASTICNADEAAIVVKVSWSDPLPHSVTTRENLLNWQ